MARSIILVSILLLGWQTTYTGNWTDAEGNTRNLPCPTEFKDRARMPQGCVAQNMGVWLSRSYYTQLVVRLNAVKKEKEEQKKLIKLQEDRIQSLELQLKIKVAIPKPSCNCIPEIFASTLVSTAGCVLWNQLP